ncbi:HWE histidine kinase domain-containing protein [Rubellimicrobium arenae]|uniref:HWE histidine kinase domain-containing protein n=1 Tax=Rubellimicrobium arenae TaxID=2817372 RepID=UPI001B30972C|nr:HWE histidine kinase domain-containing protein [Rubellimicrobium arenae]
MSDRQLTESQPQPDLSSCAREPIQFLASIQPYGCLLVISNDWVIQNASANSREFLQVGELELVGRRLTELLLPEAMHTLRGKVQTLVGEDDGARVFGLDLLGDGRRYDVALHRSGRSFLLEFERKSQQVHRDDLALVQPLLARVRRARSIEEMCHAAARGLWVLTQFARVMVYRFEPDGHGVVVAEHRSEDVGSYLGLHFPEGDIPPQARALYRRSLLRIIADVDAAPVPLVPAFDPEGRPVDLSLAVTRAVSPVHLEYLRNMQVGASMSVSILRDGELWGLMACHHPEPHYVDYETRSAVELFTQLLSYELILREDQAEREQVARAHDLHERLVMLFEAGLDFSSGLGQLMEEIGAVIDVDGIALHSGEGYCAQGLAPDETEFRRIEQHLARVPEGRVFFSENLEQACPGAVSPDRHIGGLMALPIKRHPRQFVMLFRREITQDLVWAGNPAKYVSDDRGRIHPRRSFAAWRETVRGQSAAWTPGERRAAEVLRVTLLELVLKLTTDTSIAGQKRSQKQEILISELNHRLRNTFGLLNGMLTQAAQEDEILEAYATRLGGRIRALAKANDQLTLTQQASFSLSELIAGEVAAYSGDARRVTFDGGDIRLPAGLRATLALVVHELVTNSVKYGALGSSAGRLRIVMAPTVHGGASWIWQESDGPAVVQPDRVGFGTTLITHSIPHELGGEANVEYHPEGLRAFFHLPARHVESFVPTHLPLSPAPNGPVLDVGAAPTLSGTALVVEDNFLIAMNAADALRSLGADDVLIAGTTREALRMIDAQPISLAILDVDLGGETSAAVADRLRADGVPYLLATGYDQVRSADDSFRNAHVLVKPYSNKGIAEALGHV